MWKGMQNFSFSLNEIEEIVRLSRLFFINKTNFNIVIFIKCNECMSIFFYDIYQRLLNIVNEKIFCFDREMQFTSATFFYIYAEYTFNYHCFKQTIFSF